MDLLLFFIFFCSSAVDVYDFFRSSHHCHHFRLFFPAFVVKSMEEPPTALATHYFLFAGSLHSYLNSSLSCQAICFLFCFSCYVIVVSHVSEPFLWLALKNRRVWKTSESHVGFFYINAGLIITGCLVPELRISKFMAKALYLCAVDSWKIWICYVLLLEGCSSCLCLFLMI